MTFKEFLMTNMDWIQLVGVWATLLGVIVTFLGTVLVYNSKLKSIAFKTDNIPKEHNELSKEHTNLELNQKITYERLGVMNAESIQIKTIATALREDQLRHNTKVDMLSKQELDIKKTIEHISALAEYQAEYKAKIQVLGLRITTLTAEVESLTLENKILGEKLSEYEALEQDRDEYQR